MWSEKEDFMFSSLPSQQQMHQFQFVESQERSYYPPQTPETEFFPFSPVSYLDPAFPSPPIDFHDPFSMGSMTNVPTDFNFSPVDISFFRDSSNFVIPSQGQANQSALSPVSSRNSASALLSMPQVPLQDFHYHNDQQSYQNVMDQPKKKKRTRICLSKEQLSILIDVFEHNHMPNRKQLQEVAARTNMQLKNVQNWFQNRRAYTKRGKVSSNSA